MADSSRTLTVKYVGDTSSLVTANQKATKSISGFAEGAEKGATKFATSVSKMSGLAGSLGVPFAGAADEVAAGMEKIVKGGVTGGAAFGAIAAGAAVAAGVVAKIGIEAIHAADEYEGAHARLENAVANTGASFEESASQIKIVNDAMESLGYTNTETESAMSRLVGATGSVTQAQNLMSLAADIARGRNISLADAAGILTKVETGRVGALGRLGIATKDAEGKTISQTEALRKLTEMYGGAASRYSDTFAGKMEALKARGEDLQIQLGMKLIPSVQSVAGAMATAVDVGDRWEQALGKHGLGVGFFGKQITNMIPGVNLLVDGISVLNKKQAEGTETNNAAADMQTKLSEASKKYANDLAGGHASQQTLAADAKAVADAQSHVHGVQKALTEATQEGTDATQESNKVEEEARKKSEELAKAKLDETDAILGNADANLKLQGQILGFEDGLQKYNDLTKESADEHGGAAGKARDQAQAENDLKSKAIDYAKTAEDTAKKNAELKGSHLSAKDAAIVQRDALQQVADKCAPGSPLRIYLDGLIRQLDLAAQHRTSHLDVIINAPSGPGVHLAGTGVVNRFQEGGYVNAPKGTPVPAIVHGGEYVIPANQVDASSNGKSPALGNQYTINVTNVGGGGDIGRIVVDAIRDYERRNGNAWRR